METEVKNFLRKRFSLETLKKIRLDRASISAAKNNTSFTLNINFLNKSGLQQLRQMVGNLKILSEGAEIYGNMLGRMVVLYDTAKAFLTGQNAARAFFVGGLGYYISTAAVTNLGGAAGVGALLAEGGMALSNLLMAPTFLTGSSIVLLNCPILGWAVLFVGLVGVAAFSWGMEKNLASVWDTSASFSEEMYKKVTDTVKQMRQDFLRMLMEGENSIRRLYGVPY
ncbi:MAG: hypothetical protein JSS10_01570 [Verrucomicrobia bacterium]|nr:hypothetical protein [Verrucomicrobiota bacterium]